MTTKIKVSQILGVGTAANNLVQLDGSARLPAVDGSQLLNLPGDGSGPFYDADIANDADIDGSKLADASITGAKLAPGAAAANIGITEVLNETPTGTLNGVNVTFTLAHTPTAAGILLFRAGLCLRPGSGHDYTLTGNSIVFASPPQTGENILATYKYE